MGTHSRTGYRNQPQVTPTNDSFINCWYGAAFAMPFGFLGGLLWQRQVASDTLRDFRWHILAYALFSLAMPIAGLLTYDIWLNTAAV
jgi:hypothetical protein